MKPASELETLIDMMARLPGLGPRSARRAVLHLIKNSRCVVAESRVLHLVICRAIEGRGQGARLLVDFLHHVVIEVALIRGFPH